MREKFGLQTRRSLKQRHLAARVSRGPADLLSLEIFVSCLGFLFRRGETEAGPGACGVSGGGFAAR